MSNLENRKNKASTYERSEQIKDIVERMPTKFGWVVASIVVGLTVLLFVSGWLIQYPDTVSGSVTISTNSAPIKLVASSSGRIILNGVKPGNNIQAGKYIAVIQNSARTNDVLKVKELLDSVSVRTDNFLSVFKRFPKDISLGDIHTKYYTFLNSLQKLAFFKSGNLLVKQQDALLAELSELKNLQKNNLDIKGTRESNMALFRKMAARDSILLEAKASSNIEVENSQVAFLRSKENYQTILGDISSTSLRIKDDEAKLKQLAVQLSEQDGQLQLDYFTAVDDLKDNIGLWELRYVFKAPITGRLEFLKFWSDNQQIQPGEEVFSIIPNGNRLIGHMFLPAQGAGKVTVGQEAIIKLDNYPYDEFGVLKGRVTSISHSSNTIRGANQNLIETYLVEILIPNKLITNYGAKLNLQSDFKGSADIISKEKKLIERFFDNLRYASSKQ